MSIKQRLCPRRRLVFARGASVALLVVLARGALAADDAGKKAPAADVIIFTNGDRLTGKLVREVNGTVTFHSDLAGDVNVSWDKIKELLTAGNFAVLEKGATLERKLGEGQLSIGALRVEGKRIHFEGTAAATNHIPSIPTGNAAYVIDQATLDKQLLSSPGFLQAWNGSATAGVTLVKATESQYTVTSAVALARVVPTVNWLAPRHRTTVDFNSSFGKITQPAYSLGGVVTPATETKSSILRGDAERDQYFSPRVYYLAELSYDHNFAQALQLQQIYGAGVGVTAVRKPKSQLDLKATAQYESQRFFNAAAGINQNLIGATVAVNYRAQLIKGTTFTQQLSYVPAFNNPHAYSATETDALNFPVYRNFSFTVGSLDSYLNNVEQTEPPTQRNSFQFTVGATYGIKSKY